MTTMTTLHEHNPIGGTHARHHAEARHRVVLQRRRVPGWWRESAQAALWLLVLGLTCLWVAGGGIQDLTSLGPGLVSLSRITGLVASAMLLAQAFLMARVPWLERAFGQDRLATAHGVLGATSMALMLAHVVLIVVGSAIGSPRGVWGTAVGMTLHAPGMLIAAAGTLLVCLVVVTSARPVRRRLRYESWHLLHLYAYLGIGLALPHQLWTGQEFQQWSLATTLWWGAYGVTAAAVLWYRIVVPLWRSLRSPIRVLDVRESHPGMVTVTVGGPGIGALGTQGGQFFNWRFLDGPGWTRAHPFSLSSAPDGRTLSFTAAVIGDGTRRLRSLRPGTRVLLEGPYGRMHDGVRTEKKVLLMGAGVGIAPMKSLFESLPVAPGCLTLVHRVSDPADRTFADELAAVAEERGARYIRAEGRRRRSPSWQPSTSGTLSDAEALLQICPDLAHHDVYMCGATAWMDLVRAAALEAGVPADRIHDERFQY